MNINCIICSDLFSPSSEIYATSCGHLFHLHCLTQWIERSKTCPQCRNTETDTSIHRVFFNRNSSEESHDDIVTLQAKVDNGRFLLTLKDKDLANYKALYNKHKSSRLALREISVELTNDASEHREAIKRTKEQLRYFMDRVTESDKLKKEIARLKDELSTVGYIRTVINGCETEVEDISSICSNPRILCILVTVLRRELIAADKKKQKLSDQLRADKKDLQRTQAKLKLLDVELNDLKKALNDHEKCSVIIAEFKRQLAEHLEKQDSDANQSINRAVFESPAPQRPNFNEAFADVIVKDSPTIEERVNEIKNAKSPYLPVCNASGSYAKLMQAKYTIKSGHMSKGEQSLDKYSIYNRKLDTSRTKDGCNYNGLGGHSKDDIFPQPKKLTGKNFTLKRPKSNTNLVPAKRAKQLVPFNNAK